MTDVDYADLAKLLGCTHVQRHDNGYSYYGYVISWADYERSRGDSFPTDDVEYAFVNVFYVDHDKKVRRMSNAAEEFASMSNVEELPL